MSEKSTPPIKYIDSGVDIAKADTLIESMSDLFNQTKRAGVLNNPKGFAGLFELPLSEYRQPVLLSATDGVGTKLLVTQQTKNYSTIGIDLVAMCVNDILVHGGEPLLFLDYYACGKLEMDQAQAIIRSIVSGCSEANATLNGGETAEMPTMYRNGEYDLAGFAIGLVEKDLLLPFNVADGDIIIGIPSSGVHANGFSLINHIIQTKHIRLDEIIDGLTLGETLLTPTRIYVKTLLPLIKQRKINGLAHITGGGITHNLDRVLPKNHCAEIDRSAWSQPPIFNWIQQHAQIDDNEMLQTFNCGIGMCAIVKAQQADKVLDYLAKNNCAGSVIGKVIQQSQPNPGVVYI